MTGSLYVSSQARAVLLPGSLNEKAVQKVLEEPLWSDMTNARRYVSNPLYALICDPVRARGRDLAEIMLTRLVQGLLDMYGTRIEFIVVDFAWNNIQ